ncbi:MAG: DUF1963 domain-containing protein [Clostridia bacterium]|nr:DUF1963 domain-containing protein [Clostridia bacterium]
MSQNYIKLQRADKALTPALAAREADRLSKLFDVPCPPVFMPAPPPVKGGSAVIVAIPDVPDKQSAAQERMLRYLAGELDAIPVDTDGNGYFTHTDDNDTFFTTQLPTPEEELGVIWLRFRIENISGTDIALCLRRLCRELNLQTGVERDGSTIYLTLNGVLDLFYDETNSWLDGEIDTTYAGPGVYVQALELAQEIRAAVGGQIIFDLDERNSYPIDHDFDRLRSLYYTALKQQLAFAYADEREGFPAYVGWGVDNYEPDELPGSVVTYLGRYNLSGLLEEISIYGFSYVADRRFLMRSTVKQTADEFAKTGLSLLWTSVTFEPSSRTPSDSERSKTALANLEQALTLDSHVRIPREEYLTLCALDGRQPMDISGTLPEIPHYEIGYLRGTVAYGFGSYLRRFRVPGNFIPDEHISGEEIELICPDKGNTVIECTIEYFDEGEEIPAETSLSEAVPKEELLSYDIGGSAYCEFWRDRGDEGAKQYRAFAEILIRDEAYRFTMTTGDPDMLDVFQEAVSGSRAMEDVEEMNPSGDGVKPRAVGGCFHRPDNPVTPEETLRAMEKTLSMLTGMTAPSAGMRLLPSADDLTISKMGGIPYTPAGFVRPVVPDTPETRVAGTAGLPLSYIFQLNFAELSLPGFPEKGILALYGLKRDKLPLSWSGSEQVYFRLVYHPNPDLPAEPAVPEGRALRMHFAKLESMAITPGDYRYDQLVTIPYGTLTGSMTPEKSQMLYEQFYREGSRVGGYPVFIDSDPRAYLSEDYGAMLIQIDAETPDSMKPEQLHGNEALLQLFISPERLAKGDFSQVLLCWGSVEPDEGE